MKRRTLILMMIFAGALFASCGQETDVVLEEVEQQEALAMYDGDAWRSVKPRPGKQPGSITHDGEKGRDRRDYLEWQDTHSIKYGDITQKSVGDLFIVGYNEETDEYIFEIYWGEEYTEEVKQVLHMANVSVVFIRAGYGEIYNTSHKSSSLYFYVPGYQFTFPANVCWTCTDIKVRVHYKDLNHSHIGYYKEWTRPFESLMLGEENVYTTK